MTPFANKFRNALLLCFLAWGFFGARLEANTVVWGSATGNAWLTNTNWTGNNVPGVNDIAEFDANPTASGSSTGGVGVNYKNAVNNGTFTGSEGTLGDEAVGAISVTAARTNGLYFGNTQSADATHPGGYMTFNGATVNGTANTILSDFDTGGTVTIQNDVQGASGNTFGVVLGNTANIVQLGAGAKITITSSIDQATAGSSITVLGGGNSSTTGGTLELGGTDSFTGGMTVGGASGSQAGVLQLDLPISLSATGNITVNANSQLLLNGTGSYGGAAQSLILSGTGTIANSGALRTGATGPFTWAGGVTLASGTDAISSTGGSGTLTLSGSVGGAGQMQKQGAGNLILAGAAGNYSTQVGNGTITVNSGASLGSGDVTMFQTSTNNTSLVFNNAAQAIGNLSSAFTATTGAQTQAITLNGTVLTIAETGATNYGNGAVNTLTSTIGGSGSLVMSGGGTLTLSGSNTYSGSTTVSAGTLKAAAAGALGGTSGVAIDSGGTLLLGASGAISTSGTMKLNGGTFNAGGFSQGTAHGASAPSAGLGALTLAANSTLDFGSGSNASVIAFAASGSQAWTGTLTIQDWNGVSGSADGAAAGVSEDALYFGASNSSSSLSVAQLAEIQFAIGGRDYAAAQGANGEIYASNTVVPEPDTIFAALALLGFVGYRERRGLLDLCRR